MAAITGPAITVAHAHRPFRRPYFKLKSFMASEPLSDAALEAMLKWVGEAEDLGGYVELGLLGPKVNWTEPPKNIGGEYPLLPHHAFNLLRPLL